MDEHKWNFRGKNVLITGASRGIGKNIALAYGKAGANIILNYRSDDQSAQSVKEEIESYGGQCTCIKRDVSNIDEIEKLCKEAEEVYSNIDIWVNNVGMFKPALLMRTSEELFDNYVNTNLKSCFFGMKYAVKSMIQKNVEGRIINIASYSPYTPAVYESVYGATKAGVIALTKVAAKEYGFSGIRVNALLPHIVDTDLTRNALQDSEQIIHYSNIANISDMCCFLSSDRASYITGQPIEVK